MKKWQLAPLRKMGQSALPRRSSEEKSEKIPKDSTTVICTGEKASKLGTKINRNYYIPMYLYFISYTINYYREIKNFNVNKNSVGD